MALLKYLSPRDGLPDPKGALSSAISPQAIAQASREVTREHRSRSELKRRGPYARYSAAFRADIARNACANGVSKTARKFSKVLGNNVSETTVRSIKQAYIETLRKTRVDTDSFATY